MVLGTYSSHSKLTFTALTGHAWATATMHAPWHAEAAALYQSPSFMFYHWLADDTLGLYDLLKRNNLLAEPGYPGLVKLIISNDPCARNRDARCLSLDLFPRSSPLAAHFHALFSNGTARWQSKLQRVCFRPPETGA